MKCPSCNLDYQSFTAVSLHYRNKHGTSKELHELMRQKYVNENHNDIIPLCKCGCGQVPKYYDHERGYVEYVRGHHSRVKNNWGHNTEAQKKSQEVRSEMHKHGEIFIWNKGLSKETDERVAAIGRKYSEGFTPERRLNRSRIMKNSWQTGSIVPLTGADHPNWKGGALALQPIVRSRLHASWVYPKLHQSGFKCQQCNKSGPGLEVHHDQEKFADILQKALAIYGEIDVNAVDDDFKKKSDIADWVVNYHIDNNISGIVLCESCHDLVHAH